MVKTIVAVCVSAGAILLWTIDSQTSEKQRPAKKGPNAKKGEYDQAYCPQYLIYTMFDANTNTNYYWYSCQTCSPGCPPADISDTTPHDCGGNCPDCGNDCINPIDKRRGESYRTPPPTTYADTWRYCSPNGAFDVEGLTLTTAPDKNGKVHQFRCVRVDPQDGSDPLRAGFQLSDPPAATQSNASGQAEGGTTDNQHHVVTEASTGDEYRVMSKDKIAW